MHKYIFIAFFFVSGCGGESDSEGISGSSTKKINYETFAERPLLIDLTEVIPYSSFVRTIERQYYIPGKVYIDNSNKYLSYTPAMGKVGKIEFNVNFVNTNDSKENITVTFIIDNKVPVLENNRDYTISYECDNESDLILSGYSQNIDINILNENLSFRKKIQDNVGSTYVKKVPEKSKATSDYWIGEGHSDYYLKSINHHSGFLNNLDGFAEISCNYPSGSYKAIYPIESSDWYAKKYSSNSPGYRYDINDLYFYVSALSELHSKIYLKEYESGKDKSTAFINASNFMDKVFPKSHYTGELLNNYNTESGEWIDIVGNDYSSLREKYAQENKHHYEKIGYLSDDFTNGDVVALLDEIASNYESYYIYNQGCLDEKICGVIFSDYTLSKTLNPMFDSSLNGWEEDKNIINPANVKIEWLPTKKIASVEYVSNRPQLSDEFSYYSLNQREDISNEHVDEYFFKVDLSEIYGGYNGGHPARAGAFDSGFASVYVCVKNSENENLGCMYWSDHLNKFDLAWGPLEDQSIDSSDFFNNNRLREVMRRTTAVMNDVSFTISIGKQLENYLPKVDKGLIRYIDYGIFITEFRFGNGCYYCQANVKANEINLLKSR